VQRVEQLEFQTVSLQTLDRLARGLGVRTGSLVGTKPAPRRDTDRLVEEVLAENLVLARALHGMTQEALAEASGVSRTDIAKIERRARMADLKTLERLAVPFGLSVERLLTEPRKR
jgi:transcriptional regulator with XRE-family HTH domain